MENTYKSNLNVRPMIILILFCQFYHLILSKIQTSKSLYPFTTAIQVWDIAGTHMVVVNQAGGTLEYYNFTSSNFSNLTWTTPGIRQIVTNSDNYPLIYCFGVLTNSTLYLATKYIPGYSNISFPSNSSNVLTRGFGSSYLQIYGTDLKGNYTQLVWLRSLQNYALNYTINFKANYQAYFNNSVFYAFSNASSTSDLAIFQTNNSGQPSFYNHYFYPYCPTMTLDAYNSYLVVNCGSYAQVRNANYPYDPIINITYSNYTYQVAIINNNSFVAKTDSYLYQYNILNGQIMDYQKYTISYPNNMRRVGPNSVYLFNSQYMGTWYNFSDTFVCQSNCTCGPEYVIVNSTCISLYPSTNSTNTTNTSTNTTINNTNTTINSTNTNYTTNTTTNYTNITNNTNFTNPQNLINLTNTTVINGTNTTINSTINNTINSTINSTINTTNTTNTTNISNIATNTTNTTNITTNTNTNTVNNTSITNITSTQSPSNQIYSQSLRAASIVLGNSLSILSIRFIMKSNIPISLFIEQFYLYKYYADVQYPQLMTIFMQEIQVINLLKIKPDFMNFMESNYSIERSFFYSTIYTNGYNTYSPFYFTQSIKQFLTATIPLNFSIFVIFKIISIFLSKVRLFISFGFIKMLHESFDSQSRLWTLFLTIMEADFLANSFYCLNQIAMPYSYSRQNKINFFCSLILFYIMSIYGLVGYPLMNRWCKKFSKQLLIFSKQKRQSFWLQNSIMLSLKLIKSFGHSIIFSNPEYRFGFLGIADCVILIYIFKIRKLFYNNIHLFIYFAYQSGVLFVNVLLLLRQNLLQQNSEQLGQMIQYTMMTLFSLTMLKFLISLYRTACQLFRLIFCRNKVSPNSVQKNKNQQEENKEEDQKKNKEKTEKKTKKILCKKPVEHIEAQKKQYVIDQIQEMNKNGVNTIFQYNKKYKQKGQKSNINNNNITQKKILMAERFKTQKKKKQVSGKFSRFCNDFSLP